MVSEKRQKEINDIAIKAARCFIPEETDWEERIEAIRDAWHAIVDFKKTATDEERNLIDERTRVENVSMAYDGAVFFGLIDKEDGY